MRSFFRAILFCILFLLALVLCLTLYIIFSTSSYIYETSASVPHEEAALILGASVTSTGVLSPVLKERADMALTLYREGKVQKLLVSGDDATLTYDEVYPVGKYLLSQGVPEQDIFLDYAGFDTYSSLYRAKAIFDVHSLIIVSQRFHLPRSLYIAHHLGIEAVGMDASLSGQHYFVNSLREIPADIKAVYDLFIARVPEYLGTQFPLSGDGSTTWLGGRTEMIYFRNG